MGSTNQNVEVFPAHLKGEKCAAVRLENFQMRFSISRVSM